MICKHLNAIKIDVENYEIPVLMGASAMLNSPDLNIVIIEAFGRFQEINNILNGYGYRQYYFDVKNNILYGSNGKQRGNNAIYVRDLKKIEARTDCTIVEN